jgi:hypothetical protein
MKYHEKNAKNKNEKNWSTQIILTTLKQKGAKIQIETTPTFTKSDAIYDGLQWINFILSVKILPLFKNGLKQFNLFHNNILSEILYQRAENPGKTISEIEKNQKIFLKNINLNLKESPQHCKARIKQNKKEL